MSFSDWSNAKKKKKDNSTSTSSNTSSFSSWSNAKHGISEDEENSALAWRNDEIAPVAEERTWFQKSAAYDDGYQKGDFLKAAMGTGADASLNAAAGFLGIGEKVVDAVTTAGGWLLRSQLPATMAWELLLDKILGNDTDKTIERYKNQADTIEQDVTSFVASDLYDEHKLAESMAYDSAVELRENSVLGEKSDDLMYSAGQLVGQVAVSAIPGVGQIGGLTLAGANAFGSEAESAFQQGADLDEGMLSASVAAASEVITEKIGGISYGGKTLVDYGASKLSHKMTSKLAKNLIKAGKLSLDAGTEGVEELLSGYGGAIGQKLSYMSDKEIDELFTDEDKLESFIGGVVLGGAGGSVELATQGDGYITGLTKSEQAVVDKVYKDAIAEQEADGKTLSSREKSKIYDNIVEKMEKGDIDIDTIEEVLGGDTYKEYKSILDKEKSLTDEISQYEGMPDNSITVKQRERLAEARKELENITNKDELKAKLSDEVYKIAKGGMLVESYNEKARKSQAFNADLTQYEGKQKEAVERAIKSGVLNNTNKAHALVNALAKIEADKGIVFDYTDNAKLKESGFALEGKTINGFEKDGTVTLNVQSAKAWQSTVGHEIGHILKGTDAYTELQKSLYEYAESKGELATRKAELTKLYANLDADIDEELTCDLIGDYLFTDKNFIDKLTGNRPLFKKIYDEVKYLCKVATGKELTEIEKVRKNFDNAWKEMSVKPSEGADGKVNMSVSADSNGNNLTAEQQKKFENSKVRDADGNLIPLYHGSRSDAFSVFDMEKGVWLATDQSYSEVYAGQWHSWRDDDPEFASRRTDLNGLEPELYSDPDYRVYKVYADIQNPLDIGEIDGYLSDGKVGALARALGVRYSELKAIADNYMEEPTYMLTRSTEFIELAKSKGFDGLKATESGKETWCAIQSAEQIKLTSNKTPTTDADIRYSISEDSNGNELSLAVQKRFANSKAVDENGNLKVLYHGTANGEFYTFDKSKGSVEGDFGSGFYFTDSEKDVKRNYEGGGPDFENKIARRAEQIEAEEEIDYIKARKKAIKELYVGAFEHKVYLNIENPAIVGETNLLDYDSFAEEYDRNDYDTDEDYESDVEYLIQDKIDEIIWDIQRNVDVNSIDGIAEVLWNAVNEGGIDIEQLKANINNLYLDDSNGNLVGNEVTRQIIESLGYDGIIDNTVSTKFNMNIESGTTHYIVFKPNQIKSIDNQNPTDNPDIRYSLSNNTLDNEQGLVYNGKRGDEYARTDEFRNLQAESQRMSNEETKLYHSGSKQLDDEVRGRLSRTFGLEIRAANSKRFSSIRTLLNPKTNNNVNIVESVDGSLFHDVFEIARKHLRNGELVDLHETETTDDHGIGYKYCNNYLSEDGLSGFSITPDGDLISVFNLNTERGFLKTIAPIIKEKAKTLDCYASPNQNLMVMYEKIFGFKAASLMDYNMEYDHDDIAKNHNKPQVAFMVNTNSDVETRHFTEEQYDEAVAYRNGFVMSENIAPVQKSLSYKGEQFAPIGNYSTPLNETALAPVADNTETTQNEVLETEYDDAMYDDAPMPSDADVPPVMEDNYYAETDTTAVDKKALSTIGEKLRKVLSLTAEETRAIQDIVQEYSTSENPNKEELYNKIKEKFGEKTWTERDTDLAKVKQFLKNSPLFLSDKDKADITDWSWFRKNMLNGKVKLSKDGLSVDKYYDQLVEMFPDRFGYGMSEEFGDLENQLNQIRKIAAVANEKVIKDKGMSIDDEYIQQAVDLISSEVSQYKQDLTRQAAEFTAQEALDSIAPLKATQLTDGTRGDALLNQSLDNFPIKTVDDKIAENIRAVEASLADTRQLRRETEANYNSQIAELEKRYANLKNKNTKKANNIVNSIVRLQRLKATSDAAYAKRISDLEARAGKMNSEQYNRAMHKQDKMQGYANWAADVIGDTTTWKDKKLGIQYETNTEHRNLRDIVRDANGNKDIAKADAIYEATMGEYNRNQAAKNRKVAEVKKTFADMKINHAESTYIQMLGEFRHNPDTTLTEKDVKEYYEKHKNKIDTAKVDKAIEEARKAYDTALTQLNAKLREQGMKEIPYRQGYFPHFTEPKQNFIQKLFNWKTQDNEIPTSIAGLTEDFKPNKSYQPFDKQRHGDKTDYNFLKGLDSYLDGAYDWVYHLEDIQKRRAIENHIRYTHSDEGIQAKIKEVYANEELDADEAQAKIEHILAEAKNPLNNFVQDFMTHTNILAGKKNSLDRTIEQKTNRGIYSVMTNVQNRMSANMVLANVRSALTNFIPITQSWAQVSPLRSLQATKDTIANAIKDDGLTDKSTFLTNRLKQADNLYKTSWDKVIDGAGVMFEVVDNFSSQVIWRSKYLDNIEKGMTESEAIANADQFAENVMAGRSKGNEPTIFNAKNPLVKAFTMFQLEVNNQYGYLFKDVPTDLKTETNHWKFNLAKGYTTAFIGAYAYNALMEQISGSGAALDPIGIIEDLLRDLGLFDDDEEKEPTEVLTNLIENVGEELPFVSTVFGGGRIPISSAVPYSDEGLIDGIGAFAEDVAEGNWENIGKEMMNPILNIALPVGGGQIKKTVQGLKMFNTDDEHPVKGSYTDSGDLRFPVEDTVGNRVQAAIFGQWANENARDYIENNRTPLNEKQIEEYVDVELPIADYWKYREGLKGLKKNEEKADYINSLDIADWQKNLLMNNILDRKEDVDMSNYDDYSDWEEFDYAQKNPEKYPLTKAVGGYSAYKTYSKDLYNLKADKDADGKSISGSRKEKVIDYINNLDADYETKIILFKSEYPSDDTYNVDIINYINNRNDLTYEERLTIFAELGFTVKDGYVYWD